LNWTNTSFIYNNYIKNKERCQSSKNGRSQKTNEVPHSGYFNKTHFSLRIISHITDIILNTSYHEAETMCIDYTQALQDVYSIETSFIIVWKHLTKTVEYLETQSPD